MIAQDYLEDYLGDYLADHLGDYLNVIKKIKFFQKKGHLVEAKQPKFSCHLTFHF